MRKKLLLSLLTMIVGFFASTATTLKITVDKAANVTITGSNGSGDRLDLSDGLNTFEVGSDQNPFVIEANPGATIKEVIYNNNPLYESGGMYRFGVGGPETTVVITTDGQGIPPTPQEKMVNFSIYVSGDGITGAPFTAYVEKDGSWVTPEPGDWGLAYKAPQNARMKITPVAPYEINSITIQGSQTPLEVTREADGSIIFVNTISDFYNYNLDMKISDSAVRFSMAVDYPGNVDAYLEWQRNGEHPYEKLDLKDGVNNFAILAGANPLEISPTAGSEILQVTRNGEVVNPIGWGGSGGYLITVENGDKFQVLTKGPEIEMQVSVSPNYNTKLQDYFFTRGDGTQIRLQGDTAVIKGNRGEYIYVSPRPGTNYMMLSGNNGATYDMVSWKDWFRITPGADGAKPAEIVLYGTRNVNGVILDVDDASRVRVLQEGGRGDALNLTNGQNQFAISAIKNALAISATPGNQMLRVTLNGDLVQVNAQGLYLVNATEGDYVQIFSRKSPTDFALSFTFNEGMTPAGVSIKVNGQEVESASTINLKTYDTVTLAAAPGYTIEDVTTGEPTLRVSKTGDTYQLVPSDATVTSAMAVVALKEIEPSEGNALVFPNGDPLMLSFYELEYIAAENRYAMVRTLDNNILNEVKVGNYVEVYRNSSTTKYRYIKVNGTPVEDLSNRSVKIKIEGRTVIDAEVYTSSYVYTQDVFDTNKHIVSGTLEFEVNGKRCKNFDAEKGMTVKLIPLPQPGYVFDHFEFFYPLTPADDGIVIDGDTYTFTEADCENEFLLFLGVFKPDESNPTYVVRCSNAWLIETDGSVSGDPTSAVGKVVIRMEDGTCVPEATCFAGDKVTFEIQVTDPEIFATCEVAGFSLGQGFPNNRIPTVYTVNPADADSESTIWVYGLVQPKSDGIDSVGDNGFHYDAPTRTVTSADPIMVYGANGVAVIDAPAGEASLGSLPNGLYIIVSGNTTLKVALK